jgi:hypothetical protein
MSFVATAIVGGAIAYREVRKGRKQAKKIAAEANAAAAAQTEAIQQQTQAMRQSAVTPPPPPPPAPIAAPIRQAAPGTGTSVISPSMLVRRPTTRRRTGQRGGSGLGYGSRLG